MDLKSRLVQGKSTLKPSSTVLTDFQGRRYEISKEQETRGLSSTFPFVVDDKPDTQVAPVLPGLFLSSQDPVFSREILQHREIRHVLSVGVESPEIKFPDIRYHFCPLLDLPESDILVPVKTCLRIIHSCRSENILVHCNAGISRSVTMIVAYLMIHDSLDYETALNHVKKVRPCAKPNEGFARQLRLLNLPYNFLENDTKIRD